MREMVKMIQKMFQGLLFAVCAVWVLGGCSDNLADASSVVTPPSQDTLAVPVLFGPSSKGITRAEITGASAAGLLDSTFVVSGYMGNTTASVGTMVFDNFVVKYYANTANTTESNACNWEYVGQTRIKHAIDQGVTQQAVKYWDYTKAQYDFIAWSAGKVQALFEDPKDGLQSGNVYVSAISPRTAVGVDGTAYTIKGLASDLEGCYVADLVTVKNDNYGSPVTIKFRSLCSKVRLGIFETIPGYSVKNVRFYTASDKALPEDAGVSRLFSPSGIIYNAGTCAVYYPTVDRPDDPDNNVAHIRYDVAFGNSNVVDFGSLNYTTAEDGEKTVGAVFLGRSSATASMAGDAENGYYTTCLPNESGISLSLRVDYTLEGIDGSDETLEVKGATATIPADYTRWKAGYAYTYLFKITDQTNGHTGVYDPTKPDDDPVNSDPAGLYPISFDAVVVDTEKVVTKEISL